MDFSYYHIHTIRQISWKCIEAVHYHKGHTGIKEKWLHTEVHWTFKKIENTVEISLLHLGLKPELNCFKICEPAWNYFLTISLKNYLETGIGNPHIE